MRTSCAAAGFAVDYKFLELKKRQSIFCEKFDSPQFVEKSWHFGCLQHFEIEDHFFAEESTKTLRKAWACVRKCLAIPDVSDLA